MKQLTPELLGRYDVPVPRYTSYPTALGFEPIDDLPPEDDRDGPVSLYFHMLFCRHLCWYCACTKEITRQQSRSGEYLDRMLAELEIRAESLVGRPIVQMHLGGGTPTFFTPDELEALTRFVRDRFRVAPDAELSIEIDPRELTDDQVAVLASAGYNRASLGVQDHNPEVQAAIHRVQPFETTASAVERLRAAGINEINFDLVYGLPHQTAETFRQTAEDVATLSPDRLAVYSYAHVPWVAPSQKLLLRNTNLPAASEKIAMFLAATDVFESHGYRHIGMDHFARPEDSLTKALDDGTMRRNFMGYTTHRGVDIHAFGVSAISQTKRAYFQNDRSLDAWENAVDRGRPPVARGVVLSADDLLRREVIMGVMCSHEVDLERTGARHGVDGVAYFDAELAALQPLVDDGLVTVSGATLQVTPLGRFLVRNVASVFDAARAGEKGYSQAV